MARCLNHRQTLASHHDLVTLGQRSVGRGRILQIGLRHVKHVGRHLQRTLGTTRVGCANKKRRGGGALERGNPTHVIVVSMGGHDANDFCVLELLRDLRTRCPRVYDQAHPIAHERIAVGLDVANDELANAGGVVHARFSASSGWRLRLASDGVRRTPKARG